MHPGRSTAGTYKSPIKKGKSSEPNLHDYVQNVDLRVCKDENQHGIVFPPKIGHKSMSNQTYPKILPEPSAYRGTKMDQKRVNITQLSEEWATLMMKIDTCHNQQFQHQINENSKKTHPERPWRENNLKTKMLDAQPSPYLSFVRND